MVEPLEQALALHQAGDLEKAKDLYQQLIAANPENHEVLRLLGIVLYQQGEPSDAIVLLRRSLALQPRSATWGHLALAFKATEAYEEADKAYRQALSLAPDDAALWANLGSLQRERGQLELAQDSLQKAISINPGLPEAWANLALTQQGLGFTTQTLQSWRRACEYRPDWPLAQTQRSEALSLCYRRALEMQQQGRRTAAIEAYRLILAAEPGHTSSLNNLGNLLTQDGKFAAAVECFKTLIRLAPDDAYAYGNLGVALKALRRYQDAIGAYRKALELKPDYTHALNNLATILKDLGQFNEALECFDRALAIDPEYLDAHSNRLFTLSQMPKPDPARYLLYARHYGATLQRAVGAHAGQSPRPPDAKTRPFRVGFVSGDLKSHPVGYFLEGLLANLDPQRITPIAYATTDYEDAISQRLRKHFAQWHTLVGLNDDQAAVLIREQQLDLLFDLAGHTAHHRLPVFARKPAPVQVSWLGYFASTGVAEMDYLLADEYSINQPQEAFFTEAIWRLPQTRLCFTPPPDMPHCRVGELPALRNGFITFASYQNLSKVNAMTVALWRQVLQALPNSCLNIQSTQLSEPGIAQSFAQYLSQQGIDVGRVALAGAVPRDAYLRSYSQVDMVLDTFPFPGGTTTCEALWMGVPTVTLVGSTLLSRQGGSLLRAAGFEDWVADSAAQYVEKAVGFASDTQRLAVVRRHMRQQVSGSALCDATRFARDFEAAVSGMWAATMS